MIADAFTKALSQEKFTIFTQALVLENTRIDQSRSVEDGPVVTRLVASTTAAQPGEEEQASGKPEASKRCWINPSTRCDPESPGNKAKSFSQIPTFSIGMILFTLSGESLSFLILKR